MESMNILMESIDGIAIRSASYGAKAEEIGDVSIQFGDEIQGLISAPTETGSSFTALLELPANQAVELLHSPGNDVSTATIAGELWSNMQIEHPNAYHNILMFPSNTALIDRASKFSVFVSTETSPESSLIPSANPQEVKLEPMDSDSNPNSSTVVSDPMVPTPNPKSSKRKEREKKVKPSAKKSKNETTKDGERLPYVHVRARRGQATDSHSLAERARREKINARMKLLQELVPGCNKISGTATVLDEIINHVQSLQRQVEFLSMRLAALSPRIDLNLNNMLATQRRSLMDSNYPGMAMPSMLWTEGQINGYGLHQPVWGTEEDHPNFITPETSLLSYDSSANSASMQSNQLKMMI